MVARILDRSASCMDGGARYEEIRKKENPLWTTQKGDVHHEGKMASLEEL